MKTHPIATWRVRRDFLTRLTISAALLIAGALIEWYAVDWNTFFDEVPSARGLPPGLLVYARAIDWIQGPFSQVSHWCLQRAREVSTGPTLYNLQVVAVLISGAL